MPANAFTTILAGQVIVGIGLTTTVAVIGGPGQLLALGVIVKVTVTGVVILLFNTPLMFPLPAAGTPPTVPILSLVQVYVVPATLPLNTIVVIAVPEQIVCDEGVATAFGVGLTNTVAVMDGPGQPLAVGVIVNVTVIGAKVVLVNMPLISPLPLAAIPVTVTVLSLVQLNVVPATLLVKLSVLVATRVPLQ